MLSRYLIAVVCKVWVGVLCCVVLCGVFLGEFFGCCFGFFWVGCLGFFNLFGFFFLFSFPLSIFPFSPFSIFSVFIPHLFPILGGFLLLFWFWVKIPHWTQLPFSSEDFSDKEKNVLKPTQPFLTWTGSCLCRFQLKKNESNSKPTNPNNQKPWQSSK